MSDGWLKGFFFGRERDAGGGMADENANRITYRLPLSVVKMSGEATSGISPQTSLSFKSATSDVQLSVEADPRPEWRRQLSVDKSSTKDREFELDLTPDGRLTTSTGTSAGAGATIIEAGIRVGTFVGAQLVGVLMKSPPRPGRADADDTGKGKKTFDQILLEKHPDLYRRREAYRAAIIALQDKIAAYGTAVAAAPTAPGSLLEGTVLRTALERVRAEAGVVEEEVDAWRRSEFVSSTKEYAFQVGTDDLPQLDSAQPSASFELEELKPALREAAERLGVMVARVGEPAVLPRLVVPDTDVNRGIWFRAARPTSLAVYERSPGPIGSFTLRTVTPNWVVDSDSQLSFLSFDSSLFSKNVSGLEFGETGALSHVSVNRESAARQVSAAFSAAPGQIKESVEQASAVAASLAKIKAAGAENRLADLKRRKDTVDAEIAEKGVLATRAQREELEGLKVQIDLADAQSKLAPEPTPPPPPHKELEDRLARAKLELELKQAEVGTDLLGRLVSSPDGEGGVSSAR